MRVIINRKEYRAVTSAVTALRFRAAYNKTCLSPDLSTKDMLKLLYISIEDNSKPYFHEFVELAEADITVYKSAVSVYKEIIRPDSSKPKQSEKESGNTPDNIDEFYIMAIFAQTGLPPFLWDELSIMQIVSLVGLTLDMKNGGAKSKEQTYIEAMEMYCIDTDKENAIQAYLDEHPELEAYDDSDEESEEGLDG